MFRLGHLLLTLFFLLLSTDSAQSQYQSLPKSLPKLISESPIIYDTQILIPTFDGNSIWILAEKDIWEFSVDARSWKKSFTIDLSYDYSILQSDTVNQRLLLRSYHGGNIYSINTKKQLLEPLLIADQTKYMLEHTGVVRYPEGHILIFGGYGFWQARNLILQFDIKQKEWEPIYADPQSPLPVPRAGAMGIFNAQDQQFHIFGGHTFRDYRQDLSNDMIMLSDYWVFDMETKKWDSKVIYDLKPIVDYLNKVYLDHNFRAAFDSANRIAWYPVILKENTNKVSLIAFDLDADFGAVSPITFAINNTNELIRGFFYDNKANQLLFVTVIYEKEHANRRFRVYALPLPDASEVRAQLNKSRQSFFLKQSLIPLVIIVGCFVLFIIGFRYRDRLKTLLFDKQTLLSTTPLYEIVVEISQQQRIDIFINNRSCTDVFTSFERSMIAWMTEQFKHAESHIPTDDLEARFWPNSGSMDYARKQRNVAMKRINDKFSILLTHNKPLFIERTNMLDKRKREYVIGLPKVVIK